MSKPKKDRINGPYKHGAQWRVLVVPANGDRGYRYFAEEREARAYVRDARLAVTERTVDASVAAYLDNLRERGGTRRDVPLRASSVKTAGHRLRAIFRLEQSDMCMHDLTPREAQRLYTARTKEVRADTHRGELTLAYSFCEYCIGRGWLVENPFAAVKPCGELSTGKQILFIDEARSFLRKALAEGCTDGLACATVLVLGLRASELCGLKCRDLDAGGTVLRVTTGKTARSVRNIALPDALRDRLRALAEDREPDAQLFEGMTRYRLHYQVGRFCGLAKVRRVCPHGLRGSAATVAAQGGLAVAQALLGHELGSRVTERHYIAPGTTEGAQAKARADLFGNELEPALLQSYPKDNDDYVN